MTRARWAAVGRLQQPLLIAHHVAVLRPSSGYNAVLQARVWHYRQLSAQLSTQVVLASGAGFC